MNTGCVQDVVPPVYNKATRNPKRIATKRSCSDGEHCVAILVVVTMRVNCSACGNVISKSTVSYAVLVPSKMILRPSLLGMCAGKLVDRRAAGFGFRQRRNWVCSQCSAEHPPPRQIYGPRILKGNFACSKHFPRHRSSLLRNPGQ